MKTFRDRIFRRFAAAALAAALVFGVFCTVNAEAALSRPQNCHFGGWLNNNFTAFEIDWKQVNGAQGYQSLWCWTDGSHAKYTLHSRYAIGAYFYNAPNNHVSQVKVRAYRVRNGKRVYSGWSNIEYITPSPTSVSGGIVSRTATHPQERLRWNTVYGSNGYNVFLTTNPSGTWRWNQSTNTKATSTSAVIKKYSGGYLKLYTNYYFKIVTRRKYKGVFCTVPMPSSRYYNGYFSFYRY